MVPDLDNSAAGSGIFFAGPSHISFVLRLYFLRSASGSSSMAPSSSTFMRSCAIFCMKRPKVVVREETMT